MNRRRAFILVFLIALTGAITAVLWSQSPVGEPAADRPVVGQQAERSAFQPDQSTGSAQQERSEGRPVDTETRFVPTSGQMLRFRVPESGRSPAVEATIGMAGMWPPAEASAPAGGFIPLPRTEVTTLWGDEMSSYEVLARTLDRSHGVWAEVTVADLGEPSVQDVVLGQASPLEVAVTDESGAAVKGAEVRISRGFVALVHLSKTTGEDGRAVFDGLPDGNFQVTVKADGFARKMHQLDHQQANKPVTLALVEGPTKVGNGELERLAKQVVVDGNRTVVSTGDEGEQDGEASDERTRHPLDLYVVDRTGSPVHGALVQLWSDGRRLFEKESAGRRPVRVEIASPFRGTLVAFDGQRGEGRIAVELNERTHQSEFIVTLERDLLTLDLPPGRVNARQRIEQILGAELVRDNDAWLADVISPTSAAAQAGIERGDRVVFVREVSGGYSAMIERGDQRMRVQLPASGDRSDD